MTRSENQLRTAERLGGCRWYWAESLHAEGAQGVGQGREPPEEEGGRAYLDDQDHLRLHQHNIQVELEIDCEVNNVQQNMPKLDKIWMEEFQLKQLILIDNVIPSL